MWSLAALARTDRAPETTWASILETLLDFACPSCAEAGAWQPSGRLVKRLNSYTGFASCPRCGERIFVKRIRGYSRIDPVARALRDFENATALYRALPDDGTTAVARPLAAISEVLLFTYVPGVPAHQVLRSREPEDRRAIVTRMGTWFARLHLSDRNAAQGDPDFPTRLERLRNRCGPASKQRPVIARALDLQARRLEALEGRLFPLVLLHGDAKAENFLFCEDRLVAVDVDYRIRGLPEMDLAQFLAQMRCSTLLRTNGGAGERVRLEEAFLTSYSRLRPFDGDVLEWMETYFTLSLWMNARRRGWLRRVGADALFGTALQRLLDRADRAAASVRSLHHA